MNLYVVSGDAYTGVRRLVVTVVDENDAAVDLTGTTMTFMVKRRRTDDDADALITKAVGTGVTLATPQSGATKGIAYIALDPTDTEDLSGKYPWELAAEDSVGPIRLAAGWFRVASDLIVGV